MMSDRTRVDDEESNIQTQSKDKSLFSQE